MLGARPDRHREDRGADRRVAPELHDRHRHSLDAAGGPRLATHWLFPPWNAGGDRLDRDDFYQPPRQAHAGLHHRPVRLECRKRIRSTGMSSEHIVRAFDEQLRRLENLIAEMGGLAEAQLADAIDAMSKRDLEKAARITADDQRIDELEMLIDHEAIAMLALRQPMAKDLREIVGALKAASMLERIGDYAKNVAKRTAALVETPPVPSAQTVVRLGMLAQEMIKDVLDAYIAARCRKGRSGPAAGQGAGRSAHQHLPRAADLHDGGSAQHHRLHAPPVHRQEHRAHRRSRHEHRRGRHVRRPGQHPRRGAAEETISPAIRCCRFEGELDVQINRAASVAKPRVLIVEDEDALAEMLRYNFDREGFDVVVAADGDEAVLAVEERQPDLVLLDWMLPGTSGIAVCRRLRGRPQTRALPIIMLTARGEEADRVRGLESGADDYVVKPFSPSELVARVRAVLRRSRPTLAEERLVCGEIVMDLATTASPAAARTSISARPSSACCACSWSGPAGCSRASNCSTGSGGGTFTSSCAPSTSTFAGSARRSASTATMT